MFEKLVGALELSYFLTQIDINRQTLCLYRWLLNIAGKALKRAILLNDCLRYLNHMDGPCESLNNCRSVMGRWMRHW